MIILSVNNLVFVSFEVGSLSVIRYNKKIMTLRTLGPQDRASTSPTHPTDRQTVRYNGPQDRACTSPTHPTDRQTVRYNVCYFISRRK
jgi:hypothetical protein